MKLMTHENCQLRHESRDIKSRELESRVEIGFSFQESGLNSKTSVTIDN